MSLTKHMHFRQATAAEQRADTVCPACRHFFIMRYDRGRGPRLPWCKLLDRRVDSERTCDEFARPLADWRQLFDIALPRRAK